MRALRPLMRFRRFDIDVASIDQILPQRVSQKGGHRHAAFRRGALDRPLGLSGDFDRKLDRLVIAYHHTAASASSRADSTRHDRTGDISRPSNRAGRATPDNRPRSLRRKPLPRLLEIGASMIEGGGRAVPEFSGLASRIETADPAPLSTMVRDADAARDRADMDVAGITASTSTACSWPWSEPS